MLLALRYLIPAEGRRSRQIARQIDRIAGNGLAVQQAVGAGRRRIVATITCSCFAPAALPQAVRPACGAYDV